MHKEFENMGESVACDFNFSPKTKRIVEAYNTGSTIQPENQTWPLYTTIIHAGKEMILFQHRGGNEVY